MQALEEKLQYHFKNPALLEEALRHSSYANEHRGANFFSNERLEFLGDSVLGFVTAEYLFAKHPTAPEGELTRIRALLVCEDSLHEVAQRLELGKYLKLGNGEEGCGGRTTVFEDPIDLGRNGRTSLPVCLASHNPLDLVILMLGTNDMKHYFQNNAWSIGQGVAQLLHLIQTYPYAPNYSAPKVLVVSPIHIGPDVAHSPFGSFQPEAIEISKGLAAEMQRVAEQAGCAFFDAAAVAGPCDEDSIHMDAANHAALARALEPLVHQLLD